MEYYRYRFELIKSQIKKNGICCMSQLFNYNICDHESQPITQQTLTALTNFEPKFRKESAKCIENIKNYIYWKQKPQCIMFYKLEHCCIHYKYSSSTQFIQFMHELLSNPEIKAPFKFSSVPIDLSNYLKWRNDNFEKHLKLHHPICYDCILEFWSNQSMIDIFLQQTLSLASNTLILPQALFNLTLLMLPDRDKILDIAAPAPSTLKSVFMLVQITDLWHQFMIHPQFVRYYLFKNKRVFLIFLKYWNSMHFIEHHLKTNIPDLKENYHLIFPADFWYQKYLLNKFMDISCCFYSMMKYIHKWQLRRRYLGHYIGTMETMIGAFIVCDNDLFQCILNLIWKQLSLKYQEKNIEMKQYVKLKLILLPLYDHYDLGLSEKIRKKLLDKVKCATCNKTKQRFKLCSRCKMIYYCSRKCQKLHWKYHKHLCINFSLL